jgi:hypothetical protein
MCLSFNGLRSTPKSNHKKTAYSDKLLVAGVLRGYEEDKNSVPETSSPKGNSLSKERLIGALSAELWGCDSKPLLRGDGKSIGFDVEAMAEFIADIFIKVMKMYEGRIINGKQD